MRCGILLLSFGTVSSIERDRTYYVIEEVKVTFQTYFVYHAFTSEKIISKIEMRENTHIPNLHEAMEQVIRDGITHLIVQPTYVSYGLEYEKMKETLSSRNKFKTLSIGLPLLGEAIDYDKVVDGMHEILTCLSKEEAVVLMGHGTRFCSNDEIVYINDV